MADQIGDNGFCGRKHGSRASRIVASPIAFTATPRYDRAAVMRSSKRQPPSRPRTQGHRGL